jgi:hypothetical protein
MQVLTRPTATALVAALALTAAGCGGFDLKSRWRSQDIVVDGDAAEWENTAAFTDVAAARVAVLNDANDLYVCIIPSDEGIDAQIRARGFTLWFDPAGGKHKAFGVHFPLGMLDSLSMAGPRAEWMRDGDGNGDRGAGGDRDGGPGAGDHGARSDDPDRSGDARQRRSRMRDAFLRSLTQFEILGAGAPVRLAIDADAGIRVRAGVNMRNVLAYELRVPLKRDAEHPFAIGALAGHKIGIGFETPEFDRDAMRRRAGRDGGMGGGSPGGDVFPGGGPSRLHGGGGHGGGMHGVPGGARPAMVEPLHAWGTLTLATGAR